MKKYITKCKKFGYDDENVAWRNAIERSKKKIFGIYWHNECGMYHLTSQQSTVTPAWVFAEIRKPKVKKKKRGTCAPNLREIQRDIQQPKRVSLLTKIKMCIWG